MVDLAEMALHKKTLAFLTIVAVCRGDIVTDIAEALEVINTSETFKSTLQSAIKLLQDPTTLLQDAIALIDQLNANTSLPSLDFDIWWGGSQEIVDENIYTTRTEFKTEMISQLRSKLGNRIPLNPPLDGVYNMYGFNTNKLESILQYWENEYDFKAREEYLNKYPQYVTNIQGLNITFYRASPLNCSKEVMPIILLHGWPQLNVEYLNILDQLTDLNSDYDFVFDVIVPSYPGFAYSQYTNTPGLAPAHIANMCKLLMNRLGYEQFYVHGSDMGFSVGNNLATMFPDSVLGYHATMAHTLSTKALTKIAIGSLEPTLIEESQYVNRSYPLYTKLYGYLLETGYMHEQASKPDNLAAMRDSPSGLAQYIVYTLTLSTNSSCLTADFDITDKINQDILLDILTIHWDSKDFVTAARLYSEAFAFISHPELQTIRDYPTPVPFAALKFLYESFYMPDSVIQDKFPNYLKSTTLDYGGHLGAMENPGVFADHIFSSVKLFIEYHQNK